MPASLGSAALGLAFLTAVFAVVTALTGATGERRWVDVSRRSVYALCALLTFCVVVIEIAFAGDDFSYNIVQQHSSIETPNFYKMAAMWSSQEGSLLLWAWVLSIVASLALYATRDKLRELVPWATAVAFVTLELAFVNSDFDFATVASHSSTTTPLFYRLTAMWSSQEGSLLLWVWLLSGWSSLALATAGRRAPALAPWAGAVLLTLAAFSTGSHAQ
jgi:cytochrome c biogenesis factor